MSVEKAIENRAMANQSNNSLILKKITAYFENLKVSERTNCKSSSSRNEWFSSFVTTINSIENEIRNEIVYTPDCKKFFDFYLNIAIRQNLGKLFINTLSIHCKVAYKKWVNMSDSVERSRFTCEEFSACKSYQWVELYYKQYLSLFCEIIQKKVNMDCQGEYQKEFLPELNHWIDEDMYPFATDLLADDGCILWGAMKPSELKGYLRLSLVQAISLKRASELFEMVADYPDSIVALKELKDAALSSSTMAQVGRLFRSSICKRLLHPGASTSQILDIYVSMIRSLRVLDPSDILLNFVAAPVRDYLKKRKDTIRSIVSSLTEGQDSELHVELRKGGSLEYGADEDDEEKGPGKPIEYLG